MPTLPVYLEDTYQFSRPAIFRGIFTDEKGDYCLLDETIFHPQGGGQPSDIGFIVIGPARIQISSVRNKDGEVAHYGDFSQVSINSSTPVMLEVDQQARLFHAKTHTAGHLIAHIAEDLYPTLKAVKGYHFSDGAYVEFEGALPAGEINDRISELNGIIENALAAKLPLKVHPADSGTGESRKIVIGGMEPMGCGGTHIKSLGELSKVTVTKIKQKKENVRISYEWS